jgi:hypothetical protein
MIIRHLGIQDYLACWQAMQDFTHHRTDETPDEILTKYGYWSTPLFIPKGKMENRSILSIQATFLSSK